MGRLARERWRIAALVAFLATPAVAAQSQGPPPNVNVSAAAGAQVEPAAAVDPSNPSVVVVAANSTVEPQRVFTSIDGGASWHAAPVPGSAPAGECGGDPALAIAQNGREYFAYLEDEPCGAADARTGVFVATRAGPAAAWTEPSTPVTGAVGSQEVNDKPSIAVDTGTKSKHLARVYVAWSRGFPGQGLQIVVSHSDDAGATWSRPTRVSDSGRDNGYASVATGPAGYVYVAWHDFGRGLLRIDRSSNGGDSFGHDRLVDFKHGLSASCPDSWAIPAQRRRCVRPNPIVSVDQSASARAGTVYVTYSNLARNATQDVYLASFSPGLQPLLGWPRKHVRQRVGLRDGRLRTDQFWPASAVDASSGWLWTCFYTSGARPLRHRVRFACTASRDGGRHWLPRLVVATTSSDETRPGANPIQFGDYEALAVGEGIAHPVWTDDRDLPRAREEIYTASVSEAELLGRVR